MYRAIEQEIELDSVRGTDGHSPRHNAGEIVLPNARGLRELIESQGYRCALTSRLLTPESASVDHIEPLSSGGADCMSNIQILHADVNQAKGTMTQAGFIQMCREVVARADGQA